MVLFSRLKKEGGILTSRRDRERDFKRQLIAEAAYRLFSASSFEAVTVEDIAREAEFGKGTLYLYFANKDEILVHIFQHGIDAFSQSLRRQCLDLPDVREALNTYMNLQYDFYRCYHALLLSLVRRKLEGAVSTALFASIMRGLDQTSDLVADLLQRGTREGIFVEVDPHKLARVIKNILKGFSLEALERKDIDGEQDLDLIKKVLGQGIIAREGAK